MTTSVASTSGHTAPAWSARVTRRLIGPVIRSSDWSSGIGVVGAGDQADKAVLGNWARPAPGVSR
jgi:hypothetical protein